MNFYQVFLFSVLVAIQKPFRPPRFQTSMNEEANKGNDLETRSLNIGANQEKAVDSLVR